MKKRDKIRVENADNLGIPMSEFYYIGLDDKKSSLIKMRGLDPREVEYSVYQAVTKSMAEWFDELRLHSGEKADIQFINYGDTELVYVLKYGDQRFTMLIGQPIAKNGSVKQEAELLKKYARVNPKSVVAPLEFYNAISPFWDEEKDFYMDFRKEAYITPYIVQARCIASTEEGFGIYVPEPTYHFEKFSETESEIVCACMIAKLVSLYDEKTQSGIAACKLGGGDFILEKGWNRENISAADTFSNMKLIAAREEIGCSLKDYISIIRREFGQRTYYENEADRDKNIKLNHKNRCGMTSSAIEAGIAIGMRMRKEGSAKLGFASPAKSASGKNSGGK